MYEPRRTERYYYVADLIEEIEEEQCNSCKFKNTDDPDMPMCLDLSGQAVLELPVDEWTEDEYGKAVCIKYEYASPSHVRQEEQRDQDTLELE